ncbi:peptide ABC transporter substrate-binding protein [bacterium]|nr:peptide ABC transporter substrate-binding protein [bacterium]
MSRTRWRLLAAAVSLIAVLVLAAACSSSSDNKKTTTPAGGSSSTAQASASASGSSTAQQGGSITVQALQPQSFDPHYSGFSQDISIERMVWRGLYRLDKDNKLQPEMAASQPQVSSDSLTYTVKLQSGLKWSDGAPLTAKDFVAGIVRTCAPATAGYYVSFVYNIVGCQDFAESKATGADLQALQDKIGVTAPDDTTVVFKLLKPQATFQTQLAMWYTFPVPTQIVKNPATDKWPDPTALAFNGPFKITAYTEKSGLTLEKNPNYKSSSSHAANLDKVTEKYIEDTEQADNAFRAGQLDEALANLQQLSAIKSDSATKDAYFAPDVATATLGLQMNLTHKPLDNEKVRIALSQAIDRDQFNQVVNGGAYSPTTSWLPGDLVGIKADAFKSQIGYNPDQAKKNLADAGYPDGKGFPTLTLEIRDTPTNNAGAAFIQNAFKTVLGINLNIKTVDSKTRSADYSGMKYDFLIGGWIQDYPDPEDWIDGQFNTGGSQNFTGCSNPQLDDLFNKAKVNLDNTSRIQQYKQINEIISTTICGIASLWNQPPQNYLISPKITGMKENSTGQDALVAADWNAENWALAKK